MKPKHFLKCCPVANSLTNFGSVSLPVLHFWKALGKTKSDLVVIKLSYYITLNLKSVWRRRAFDNSSQNSYFTHRAPTKQVRTRFKGISNTNKIFENN